MNCFNCENVELVNLRAEVPAEVKGESFVVEMDALVCPNCGYTTIHGSKTAEYMRLAADKYRSDHSRLTSTEIKTRRAMLQMSQEQFNSYLGVGRASVKRWEVGHVQDEAMNRLIVLMTDPEALRRQFHSLTELLRTVGYYQSKAESQEITVGFSMPEEYDEICWDDPEGKTAGPYETASFENWVVDSLVC